MSSIFLLGIVLFNSCDFVTDIAYLCCRFIVLLEILFMSRPAGKVFILALKSSAPPLFYAKKSMFKLSYLGAANTSFVGVHFHIDVLLLKDFLGPNTFGPQTVCKTPLSS